MLTRFAPTPSGYLHLGNIVNLLLVRDVARHLGLRLLLRIDDIDSDRYRPEYVADVFRVLEWLDIAPDVGPRQTAELSAWSQTNRIDRYWEVLLTLAASGADLFACSCSRQTLVADRCVRGCALPVQQWQRGEHAIRLRSGNVEVTLWGKFHPAYHLASVVDDADFGVTHVVRGEDLRAATDVHVRLAQRLGLPVVYYAHHPLVTGPGGRKLSKSQGTARLDLTSGLARQAQRLRVDLWPGVLAQFGSHPAE